MSTIVQMPVRVKLPPADMGEISSPGMAFFEVTTPSNGARITVSAICCFQTLEHVPEPGRLVRDACGLLHPGGLFLAVVHDRHAWINRLLGRRSPIVDIEHLQLFTRRGITRLLVDGGLEVEGTWPIVNTYPLRYWLRLLPLPNGAKQTLLAVVRGLSLDGLNVAMPVGNLLAVGRKPRQ